MSASLLVVVLAILMVFSLWSQTFALQVGLNLEDFPFDDDEAPRQSNQRRNARRNLSRFLQRSGGKLKPFATRSRGPRGRKMLQEAEVPKQDPELIMNFNLQDLLDGNTPQRATKKLRRDIEKTELKTRTQVHGLFVKDRLDWDLTDGLRVVEKGLPDQVEELLVRADFDDFPDGRLLDFILHEENAITGVMFRVTQSDLHHPDITEARSVAAEILTSTDKLLYFLMPPLADACTGAKYSSHVINAIETTLADVPVLAEEMNERIIVVLSAIGPETGCHLPEAALEASEEGDYQYPPETLFELIDFLHASYISVEDQQLRVPEPPSEEAARGNKCRLTTAGDDVGLDGVASADMDSHLCPPCTYITRVDVNAGCWLDKVLSFDCSDGSTYTIHESTRFIHNHQMLEAPDGFDTAWLGTASAEGRHLGEAGVKFRRTHDKSVSKHVAYRGGCTLGKAEGPVPVEYNLDARKVTCNAGSKIVGLQVMLDAWDRFVQRFDVVCGRVDGVKSRKPTKGDCTKNGFTYDGEWDVAVEECPYGSDPVEFCRSRMEESGGEYNAVFVTDICTFKKVPRYMSPVPSTESADGILLLGEPALCAY